MSNIIEVRNLKKYYTIGESLVKAVDGISLKIEEGDFTSIMGPSGSGKSTFLYLLGALEAQTEGEILFQETPLDLANDKKSSFIRRKKMGFIFQNYNLIPNFTVRENILLPILLDNEPIKSSEEKINELLGIVGLSGKKNSLASKLSGGQQQRVAIARALMNNPSVILADEPTGSLDSMNGNEIMVLLKEINSDGRTIVQVTHSENAAQYGKQIVNLKDGKIVSSIQI